ncbi:hypothetical protein ACGFNU_45775 [Spirillospora sp. NPDC048911]|uniref:hypothetical protein n=1 Tax=Spirillospora sp. NPDC048911 TaxID=3364527 RepID=UPI00371B71A9
MIDDSDEPLEGDIGPSACPSSPPSASEKAPAAADAPAAGDAGDVAAELRRYEEEREARRRRTNAASGRIAAALAGLLLAFLAYDSIDTALQARDKGDPWLYPPATIAALCVITLGGLLTWAFYRRRR